jgi:hypothetical protein
MIYFFINISGKELDALIDKLPRGSYCFFQVQQGSTRYYCMIKEDGFAILNRSLSAETRQNVEVLDKNIFQLFFLQNISDNINYIGNRRLMVHLSSEI